MFIFYFYFNYKSSTFLILLFKYKKEKQLVFMKFSGVISMTDALEYNEVHSFKSKNTKVQKLENILE